MVVITADALLVLALSILIFEGLLGSVAFIAVLLDTSK